MSGDTRRGGYKPGDFGKFDGDNGGMFVEPTKEFNPDRAKVVRMNLGIRKVTMRDGVMQTSLSRREGQEGLTVDAFLNSINQQLKEGGGGGPERGR